MPRANPADETLQKSAPQHLSRQEQILDIAAQQFRARGYAAVSMRDIATKAGIRTPSLYYHFACKDDLVIAVMDRGIVVVREAVTAAIDAQSPGASPAHILAAAMRAHLRALHGLSDYTSANVRIFGQLPEPLRRANLAERRAYQAIWSALLAPVCPPDTSVLQARVAFVIGALNATLEWVDPVRNDLDQLTDHLSGVLLHGLLAKVPT